MCKKLNRRDFFKDIAKLGLSAAGGAVLPPALQALLDFESESLAAGKNSAVSYANYPEAQYYRKLNDGQVQCFLCPNHHIMKPGEVTYCRTRINHQGTLRVLAYNNPCILNIDEIEKGPFYHFLPGTKSLALGIGGCNLRCLYCQNWEASQERPDQTNNILDLPKEEVAKGADEKKCRTICYTYTEPVVYLEYIKEAAAYTSARGIRNVVCTAGFINPEPLKDMCRHIDAFAVTLKAFNDKFYQKICGQTMAPVLKSMEFIKEQNKWLEIINLIVPTYNDDMKVIEEMCQWVKEHLGAETPIHFGRFMPEYKLRDLPQTPIKIIDQARQIGLEAGLKYVYTFNVAPHEGNNTFCPNCGKAIIKRLGFKILENNCPNGACKLCGTKLPGVWE